MWNRGNPTRNDWYLVTTGNSSVTMAYWMDNKFRDFDDMFIDVIAWQELPAPADERFKPGDLIRWI